MAEIDKDDRAVNIVPDASGMKIDMLGRRKGLAMVFVSEIQNVSRMVDDIHVPSQWVDTLIGAFIGIATSAVFGLFSLTGASALWAVIGMWVLLFVGFVGLVLCVWFRAQGEDCEKKQKTAIKDELNSWYQRRSDE